MPRYDTAFQPHGGPGTGARASGAAVEKGAAGTDSDIRRSAGLPVGGMGGGGDPRYREGRATRLLRRAGRPPAAAGPGYGSKGYSGLVARLNCSLCMLQQVGPGVSAMMSSVASGPYATLKWEGDFTKTRSISEGSSPTDR
jgi:hypothetical protein